MARRWLRCQAVSRTGFGAADRDTAFQATPVCAATRFRHGTGTHVPDRAEPALKSMHLVYIINVGIVAWFSPEYNRQPGTVTQDSNPGGKHETAIEHLHDRRRAALAAAPVIAEETKTGTSADRAEALALITDTPTAGFELAISLARRAVTATQPDKEVLFDQRPHYAEDAEALIDVSGVVAIHFQTIAAANDYWRD